MNFWYLTLGTAVVVMFLGLFIHWSVVVSGALLPFLLVVREWRRRRPAGSADRS